jgi:hypothetical protein
MKCCGSRPAGRKRPSGAPSRSSLPSPGESLTSDEGLSDVTPTGRRRLRVGQPVMMLDETSARAAYKAHAFRHPVTNLSLLELSWEDKARPRCGSRGVVAEYNNSQDFAFVRFRCVARRQL